MNFRGTEGKELLSAGTFEDMSKPEFEFRSQEIMEIHEDTTLMPLR